MSIKKNIADIKQYLPDSCKLIVVSKTQPLEKVLEAYESGHRIFGENKVQELSSKYELLPKDIEWHLIGHLQTNKVKYDVPFVYLIHAVDSLKLLTEINKQAQKVNRVIKCLLQIHISEEETKFGFSEDELQDLVQSKQIDALTYVHVVGLMGMATFTDNADQVRKEFRHLKGIFDNLLTLNLPKNIQMKELSMGMSGDYQIALGEGSTMIRIGTSIFGERNYETT
jgi:pyridoxal phosphate enzyme (YggS family)